MPLFKDSSVSCQAPLTAVAEWLSANIFDELSPAGALFLMATRFRPEERETHVQWADRGTPSAHDEWARFCLAA